MDGFLKLYSGIWKSNAVSIIIKYNIPLLIEQGKNNVHELAKELEFDSENLYRLLRSLSRDGLFIEMEEEYCFKNSPLSKMLLNENGIINHAHMALNPKLMESWLHLEDSIKSGTSKGMESIGYKNLWSFSQQNPEFRQHFIKAMSFQTQMNNQILNELNGEILNNHSDGDGEGAIKVICDIGGSNGKLLSDLLAIYPSIEKTINFDLPMTINSEISLNYYKSLPETIRSKLVNQPGDFFNLETLPSNVDLFIMKRVLHDWDNNKSIEILNNIFEKMKSNSQLIILEGILPPKNQPDFLSTFDLLNLHIIGGKERTKEEWEQLIQLTKFKSIKLIESYNNKYGISKIILKKN